MIKSNQSDDQIMALNFCIKHASQNLTVTLTYLFLAQDQKDQVYRPTLYQSQELPCRQYIFKDNVDKHKNKCH